MSVNANTIKSRIDLAGIMIIDSSTNPTMYLNNMLRVLKTCGMTMVI